MAEAAGFPDFKGNRYNPKDDYGGFLARIGVDFARRVKDECSFSTLAVGVIQRGITYAMNPVSNQIVNPLFPFNDGFARPEIGRNINTVDGILGANYENKTLVGRWSDSLYKSTGDSLLGNLIEESPKSNQPGASGPNPDFERRTSPVEKLEAKVAGVAKGLAEKLGKKFTGGVAGLGAVGQEQFSDVAGTGPDGASYLGKYGDVDNRWTTAQAASIGGLGDVHLGSSVSSIVNTAKKTISGYDTAKNKMGPSMFLPDDWTDFDVLYDDGSSIGQFDMDDNSPWVKTMPLVITDLRADHSVYFKAFVDGITEKYAPKWQSYEVFARPEPYHQWLGCTRQYSFKLSVYAFSPPELNVIYKKLNFLAQLQYGTYHNDGRPKEPPLCRIRLGDLIKKATTSTAQVGVSSGGGEGLAGYIDGLDVTYPDGNWEFEAGSKVPKSFELNMTFNVIHEQPVNGGSTFYDIGDRNGIGRSQAFKDMFESVG